MHLKIPGYPSVFRPVNPGLCAGKSPGLAGLISGVSQYSTHCSLSISKLYSKTQVTNDVVECYVVTANCSVNVLAYSANDDCTRRIGQVKVNGVVVWQGSWAGHFSTPRGVNTLRIDPFSCSVLEGPLRFDTYESQNSARKLTDYLQQLDDGSVIVGVTADEASRNLSSALPTLREFGIDVADVGIRGSFSFIAQKGYPDKTVLRKVLTEEESNKTPARVHAVVTGTYALIALLG